MLIISHRGNLDGPDLLRENTQSQVIKCIDLGFDVEIDVWANSKNNLYLGHDLPLEEIDLEYLDKYSKHLWIHCKNFKAIELLSKHNFNYFWHENDKMTITSKGIPWCYPNNYISNGITVVLNRHIPNQLNVLGICTDYPIEHKNILESR